MKANADAISNINSSVSELSENAVQYDKGNNKGKVTLGGANGTTIANVKDGIIGAGSKDAVNGGQLYSEQQAREAADAAINQKIGVLNQDGNYIRKDASVSDNLSTLDDNVKSNTDAIQENNKNITDLKDMKNLTETGRTNVRELAKEAVKVSAGHNITVSESTSSATGSITYTVNAETNGKVTSGDTGIVSGGTVYDYFQKNNPVQSDGKTATLAANDTAKILDVSGANGGRVITGVVTDVSDENSAANVGYVNDLTQAVIYDVYNGLRNVDRKINKVGAGAAALAALHPMDFDPTDKWDFAAGVGHYHNANAASLGAFYRPNENTMFSIGAVVGNGENMINAGLTLKLGKGSSSLVTSRTVMGQELNRLKKEHEQDQEVIREMKRGECKIVCVNRYCMNLLYAPYWGKQR